MPRPILTDCHSNISIRFMAREWMCKLSCKNWGLICKNGSSIIIGSICFPLWWLDCVHVLHLPWLNSIVAFCCQHIKLSSCTCMTTIVYRTSLKIHCLDTLKDVASVHLLISVPTIHQAEASCCCGTACRCQNTGPSSTCFINTLAAEWSPEG